VTKKNYHVIPRGNGWAVKLSGAERASSRHSTQGDAIDAGKQLAQSRRTELVIHRPNGQIRDSDSYGKDSCPPKDAKH
jgi:hypothetical protein